MTGEELVNLGRAFRGVNENHSSPLEPGIRIFRYLGNSTVRFLLSFTLGFVLPPKEIETIHEADSTVLGGK